MARRLSIKATTARAADKDRRNTDACREEARQCENDHQEGAIGMLPEGYGVDAPNVHGAPPERQRQLQDACALLAQNPSSHNDHLRPMMRVDPPPSLLDDQDADHAAAIISPAPGVPAPHAGWENAAVAPFLPTLVGPPLPPTAQLVRPCC